MNDFESISEEVLRLLQEFAAALENPEALAEVARSLLPGNAAARAGKDVTPHEMAHWFHVATQRCDDGEFAKAIPIALNLLVINPFDFRYSFMLGSCFQRTSRPREAIPFFLLSAQAKKIPATFFRLGECFAAIDDAPNAVKAFDAVATMTRGRGEFAELRKRSLQAANELSRSFPHSPLSVQIDER
jgi:tetratricopeptide (TPR) repeat protein